MEAALSREVLGDRVLLVPAQHVKVSHSLKPQFKRKAIPRLSDSSMETMVVWTPPVDDLPRKMPLCKQGQTDMFVGFKTEFHYIAQDSLKLDIQPGPASHLSPAISVTQVLGLKAWVTMHNPACRFEVWPPVSEGSGWAELSISLAGKSIFVSS